MSRTVVEGLTFLGDRPRAAKLSPHRFSLPPGFEGHKYASSWVEDGPAVREAMQPETIEHANVRADGWQVYKCLEEKKISVMDDDLSDDKKSKTPPKLVPYTRVVGKKVFVLMFRPKKLQQALNKIYADVSRDLVNQEVKGETAAANTDGDPGILTNADLRKAGAFDEEAPPYPTASAGGQPTRIHEAAEVAIQ